MFAARKSAFNRRRAHFWTTVLFCILFVAIGGAFLFTLIPAQAATVTITPLSRQLPQITQVGVTEGRPSAEQIHGRAITYTTPVQMKTVTATGQQGFVPAQQAIGSLMLSQPSTTMDIAEGQEVTSRSGVVIVMNGGDFTIVPGQIAFIGASAQKAGSAGNIPAYDVDGWYKITNSHTHQAEGSIFVQNSETFTDGSDAHNYSIVQQEDIDNAVASLAEGMTLDAQQKVKQLLKAGEQFVSPLACQTNQKSNHQSGDVAQSVTVNVSVQCTGEAYTLQDVQTMAKSLYIQHIQVSLGSDYVLDGSPLLSAPWTQSDYNDGTATLALETDAIWVPHFSQEQQRALVQQMVGKPQRDVTTLLLRTRGIKSVTIATDLWFGSALPSTPDKIKIVITSVPGLTSLPNSG